MAKARLIVRRTDRDFITCQECGDKVPFVDFIEQRLKSDAGWVLFTEQTAVLKFAAPGVVCKRLTEAHRIAEALAWRVAQGVGCEVLT